MVNNIQTQLNRIETSLTRTVENATNRNAQLSLLTGQMNTLEYMSVRNIMESLEKYDILVGIPDETNRRQTNEISNAELAYIQTHGTSKKEARNKINELISNGETYSSAREKAHQLYLLSHGSPAWHIPPRPIIEPAIEDAAEEINNILQKALSKFLNLDIVGGERLLKATGMKAQNKVRAWFTNPKNNWPPNAPSTVKTKGSERPLIDTGELRKSIIYVIKVPTSRALNRIRRRQNEL